VFHINKNKFREGGFSLIELLVVIAIIGILSSIVLTSVSKVRNTVYFTKAKAEFRSFNQALELYLEDNNDVYPPDASRDIPPGLETYLGPGTWPDAAWPGSVFDWENWDDPDNPGEKIYQLSIRFCPIGQPSECKFPNEDWASSFDINSSVFYCFSGNCRSHVGQPTNHPGYCINCSEPEYPYGIY